MRDFVLVTGMVLVTSAVNDYDRRLVLLTKERGKITVFANGVRRVGNSMMAATNPFCFGTFKLYEGKEAYTLKEAEITYYFEELRSDFEGVCLGTYFLEYADYYTRENNDETQMLKLLFQSIRAVIKETIDNDLIKVIYELKSLCINGEFPGIPKDRSFLDGTLCAIDYIVNTPIEKLYTFAVTKEVLDELSTLSNEYRERYIDRRFKSLEMVEKSMLKI